jgi:hypothetical protein
MTADQQLRLLVFLHSIFLEEFSKLDVRIDNIRDALRGIEASNLYNILPCRPLEFVHLFLDAEAAEFSHVEFRIPRVEFFVETVQPTEINLSTGLPNQEDSHVHIRCSAQECQLLDRYVTGDELAHRVTLTRLRQQTGEEQAWMATY